MITAQEAAKVLGVSARMMYSLAAPNGPIPCSRYSAKCVRFSPEDLDEYKKSCLHTSIQQKVAGSLSSTRLSITSESALQKLFRKAGIAPKPMPSQKRKRIDSTKLQLVAPSRET